MSRRTNCKFFAQGTCFKGEHCEFLHNWKDPPNICAYYQKGMCTYGSRCRFVHVKSYRPDSSASSSTLRRQRPSAGYIPRSHHSEIASSGKTKLEITSTGKAEVRDASSQFPASSEVIPVPKCGMHDLGGGGNVESKRVTPVEHPLCSLAADGICPHGENCPQIHGDLCPACGKQCLHPFSPQERGKHIKACEEKQQKLEALKRSMEIECSVCLERVLSKATAAEKKFGILSECDHPFCISCIRNWRNSTPSSGMDVNNTLRACPVCRKLSYFVVPSVVWYSTPEDKQDIIENYKAKLRLIDCKHFKFGNGSCPFGTSCFYKHTVKPGSYMWKYNRPPPRRQPPARGRDLLGVDVSAVFEHLLGGDMFDNDEDYDYDYDYDYDFDDEDDLSPIEMAFLLMHLNPESGSSSGEDESLF